MLEMGKIDDFEFIDDDLGYVFERDLFGKEMNRVWMQFEGEARSLRDIYLFLRIIQQEKDPMDDGDFFKTNSNEIRYRSLLSKSQVKKYINILIGLGLVKRNTERAYNTSKKKFESISCYSVAKINSEAIYRAKERIERRVENS